MKAGAWQPFDLEYSRKSTKTNWMMTFAYRSIVNFIIFYMYKHSESQSAALTSSFIWLNAALFGIYNFLIHWTESAVHIVLQGLILSTQVRQAGDVLHMKGSSLLKGQCHAIFCFRFFHESHSPRPLKITVGSFRIFSKIRGDICRSRCTTSVNDTGGKLPPVSTTPAANFATSSACVVDTGGK